MKFSTIVEIPKSKWTIEIDDRLLLLGSCFADNIGERMKLSGMNALTNPFGTLYNPASVAETLNRLLDNRPFSSDEIEDFGTEGWGSWACHTLLSRPNKDEALQVLNERYGEAAEQLRAASVLVVTFGTAWVFRLTESGAVVANCHHAPAARFRRERMSVEEIVAIWSPLLERLQAVNPALNVLFTVSPIRHLRDGMHANQVSKATLLLAVERLTSQHTNTAYFPAYEIVLDELRDYRFFAEDMTHPSPQAVDYLWERFSDTYFDAETQASLARIAKVMKALEHRPLHPESNEYQQFQSQLQEKIAVLKEELPELNIDLGKY